MTKRIIDDITEFIFVEDEPEPSDIIFMPGSSSPDIPEMAAKLYREGYANKLLPSGGVSVKSGEFAGVKSKKDIYNGDYKTDCEFYCDVLIKNQVPEDAIYIEDKSGHTRDNAFFSKYIADENHLDIKKGIICCKSFHARRCLMFYQLAFPKAQLLVVPVDTYEISRDNWYKQEYGLMRVLGELTRIGSQFTEDMKNFLL